MLWGIDEEQIEVRISELEYRPPKLSTGVVIYVPSLEKWGGSLLVFVPVCIGANNEHALNSFCSLNPPPLATIYLPGWLDSKPWQCKLFQLLNLAPAGFFYDWHLARNDQFSALIPSRFASSTCGERKIKPRLAALVVRYLTTQVSLTKGLCLGQRIYIKYFNKLCLPRAY